MEFSRVGRRLKWIETKERRRTLKLRIEGRESSRKMGGCKKRIEKRYAEEKGREVSSIKKMVQEGQRALRKLAVSRDKEERQECMGQCDRGQEKA